MGWVMVDGLFGDHESCGCPKRLIRAQIAGKTGMRAARHLHTEAMSSAESIGG